MNEEKQNKIFQLRINGIIEIEKPIETDKEYSILLDCIGNKDGRIYKRIDTMDREVFTYVMENKGNANLLSEEQKQIKGKAKKMTKSQTWRFIVEQIDNYDLVMDKIIANPEQILNFIKTL